jgi:hypothetical protein
MRQVSCFEERRSGGGRLGVFRGPRGKSVLAGAPFLVGQSPVGLLPHLNGSSALALPPLHSHAPPAPGVPPRAAGVAGRGCRPGDPGPHWRRPRRLSRRGAPRAPRPARPARVGRRRARPRTKWTRLVPPPVLNGHAARTDGLHGHVFGRAERGVCRSRGAQPHARLHDRARPAALRRRLRTGTSARVGGGRVGRRAGAGQRGMRRGVIRTLRTFSIGPPPRLTS